MGCDRKVTISEASIDRILEKVVRRYYQSRKLTVVTIMLLLSGIYYFDGGSQQKAKVPGGTFFIFPQNCIHLQCIFLLKRNI